MTQAYINYPNPAVTLHGRSSCGDIRKMRKSVQRRVRVDESSVSLELQRFRTKHYRFGANSTLNDMWLEVDFEDATFEEATVRHVHRLLSVHYKPFAAVTVEPHCS